MDVYKSFTKRFLEELLVHIGDTSYQIRVWEKAEGPECDSFDDTINDFDYYINCIKTDYHKYGLSEKTFSTLLKLEKMIDDFCDNNDYVSDSEIVLNNEWLNIARFAQQVCKKVEKDMCSER